MLQGGCQHSQLVKAQALILKELGTKQDLTKPAQYMLSFKRSSKSDRTKDGTCSSSTCCELASTLN